MKLEDIRLVLASKHGVKRLTRDKPKKELKDEKLCQHPGCLEDGVVPDGGLLYCSDHHFKCATWSDYGEDVCRNRVAKLGDVCSSCQGVGRENRKRRGRRWY